MGIDIARIEEIFAEALTKADVAARTQYLEQACGADSSRRQRVEA
jgi:hypothetical protein